MPILEDLLVLWQTANVAIPNVNIFATSKAAIPAGDGPYTGIRETGGTSPTYVHNQNLPAYAYPTVQLVTCAKTSQIARAALKALLDVACNVRNQTINGTLYQRIRPMQEIGDRGLDNLDRPTVGVNLMATKVSN